MSRLPKLGLAATLLLISAPTLIARAQVAQAPLIYGEPDGLSGADCEGVKMRLDFIAIAAGESGGDQAVIIIARLGSGEKSRTLIGSRLRQVAGYLNSRVSGGRIIKAEGERVRGLGRLEFYVGGRLHSVFKIRRNRDLVKGCAPVG